MGCWRGNSREGEDCFNCWFCGFNVLGVNTRNSRISGLLVMCRLGLGMVDSDKVEGLRGCCFAIFSGFRGFGDWWDTTPSSDT